MRYFRAMWKKLQMDLAVCKCQMVGETWELQDLLRQNFVAMARDSDFDDEQVLAECEVLMNTRPHFRPGDEAHEAMLAHRPHMTGVIRYLACP